MSSKRYVKHDGLDFDNLWEEDIERLKHDIKEAEDEIFKTERKKLFETLDLAKGLQESGTDILESAPNPSDLSSNLRSEASPTDLIYKWKMDEPFQGQWVSPTKLIRRTDDVFSSKYQDSSFDCGSSVISLDFGLITPKKNWGSPPQRIERAQNREWSSPHRVIDRPNPENSPGNWIPIKESCPTVQHSFDIKQAVTFPQPRSVSQATYTLPERTTVSPPVKRKTTTLDNYEPERKRLGEALDSIENDKIRRVVDPDGHVIKISLLENFEVPSLCKTSETAPRRKKIFGRPKSQEKKTLRTDSDQIVTNQRKEDNKENEEKTKDLNKNTQQVIKDLEMILKGPKEGEEEKDKLKSETRQKTPKPRKIRPKAVVEEKPAEVEKRKRIAHPKEVQEYIKSQKQKRMAQVKTEKKTKVEEREARKKKLEELRIKTLKLASQSKKKKVPQQTIKVVEPGTEDEITMSLGLKQIKPKVSYNESVSNLRKKFIPQQKPASEEKENISPLTKSPSIKEEEIKEPVIIQQDPVPVLVSEPDVDCLRKPEETVQVVKTTDFNETLKKLAEALHTKLEEKEKHFRSRPMSVVSKTPSQVPSQESIKPEDTKPKITVDLETIHSLKEDIKQISEHFKILHELIVEKVDLKDKASPEKPETVVDAPTRNYSEESNKVPDWLKSVMPRPHPYNVFTAYRQKMNLKTPSVSSQSSTYAEPVSNKYDSDFEALSIPSDRLRPVKPLPTTKSTSGGTSEENYYSMKEDSGSELSSSILDSRKQSVTSKRSFSIRSEIQGSVVTELTSRSICPTTSKESSSTSRSVVSNENMILVTPDIKLIANDLHEGRLNNYSKKLNNSEKSVLRKNSLERVVTELNNSDVKSSQKTDSTITEMIDNLSENEKSVKSIKSTNEKPQNAVQRLEEVQIRRSFFQPEVLHLQFQAELSLLETFQQSLTHFLEAERLKTLSEVNKIVYEKAINTEKPVLKEDQAVQTTFTEETSGEKTSETESVRTEIGVTEESIKTEKQSTDERKTHSVLDVSYENAGISFQMLTRMLKDEELRSEHQLALIRLREKTLNDKVKAELTFLEMKKRALKEKGSDEEQNVSAIKKKQRGILLKYQNEKEEIERLKKMHRIASEERKIMIKQQKKIQQMQLTTKDMIIKLKRSDKSPQNRTPIKLKALKAYDSQSSIQEDLPLSISDSILTESIESSKLSNEPSSNDEGNEYFRKNMKPKKSLLGMEKYPRKRHSVEELLSWTKRLEEKESRLRELEKQTLSAANTAKTKLLKSLKISVKDRSTSPFQFPDSSKTISEISPSGDASDVKKSSVISEAIESVSKTETEKTETVPEKIQSVASEDIPEEFSKKISTVSSFRTVEYNSESFESPSSSETPKTKPEAIRSKSVTEGNHKGIAIRLSLSPRMQSPRRRYSSGSDDSLNLSHTETASEQSDVEIRIAALHEQLRMRKLEAERLRREQKKVQRERLKVKEQSLLKQIQAYDAYIQKKKQELEQEYEHSNQTVTKPQIKQPKVAEKSNLKKHELILPNECLQSLPKSIIKIKTDPTPEKFESDSEITEQIKAESSESIKEQIPESVKAQMTKQTDEEEQSVKEVESLWKEASEAVKSTSVSESLPEPDDGTQSESEDQSVSIKTTLHSPEKPETEKLETSPSEDKQTIDEDVYLDSFESYESRKKSECMEVTSDISSEVNTTEPSAVLDEEQEEAEKSIEVDESLPSVKDDKKEKAEKIVESIILELMMESVMMFSKKKQEVEKRLAEESKLNLETLSSFLAKEIINEAVDDILRIYNRKAAPEEGPLSPDKITSEVRKRICEIMAQATGVRDQKRPQDMMVTTFDVSPEGTPPGETVLSAVEREEFLQSLSQEGTVMNKVFSEEKSHTESKADNFGQEWFDDDFGLSRTRREAEELRLQQLQIEQEIQQLQAQQDQIPYFYLREIPNKPPPPYTPPGKPLAEVPTSESDIIAITSTAVRILTDELGKGKQISDIEPSWDYYGNIVNEQVKCYKLFLFDLSKQIISEVIEQQETKTEVLPWLRTQERLSKYKYWKIERTLEGLNEFVRKQVLVLFGFGKKVGKESLMVKWIKKMRDHVDEILVSESQEEEPQWTRYDEDQVTIKNEVTLAILDNLLDDTVECFSKIFTRKSKQGK